MIGIDIIKLGTKETSRSWMNDCMEFILKIRLNINLITTNEYFFPSTNCATAMRIITIITALFKDFAWYKTKQSYIDYANQKDFIYMMTNGDNVTAQAICLYDFREF